MRSLRTRLVLISTFISGVAIIGVSTLAWYFMVGAVRDAIDLRLEGISGRLIRDMHPRVNWERMRARIGIIYGDDFEEDLLQLHLRDDVEDQIVYSTLDDYEYFRGQFPEGFPNAPPEPMDRPEWKGEPGAGRMPPPVRGDDEPLTPEEIDELLEMFPGEKGSPKGLRDRPGKGGKAKGRPPRPGGGKGPERAGDPEPDDYRGVPLEEEIGNSEFETVTAFGKEWRVVITHERGYYVMAALDLTQSISELKRLERALLVGIPLAIVLIGFGGWLVADRALRPVRKIAETTSHITARDLSARIEGGSHSDPEIERLIAVLNDMMDRLETGFSHATRFSADVSHELKTPITVMQAEIESALRECDPETPEENRLIVLREETNRLKSITRSLMLLSQADVGELIRKADPVDLSEEVRSLVEDAEILAESAEIGIESAIEDSIEITGDATLLRQALLNLINNGIKYNEKGGFVRIGLARDDGSVLVSVENSGPGIPEEDREKVFERFYRADRSRSREVDGFGLGLSMAEAVIEGHGGEIRLDKADDESTRFTVSIPVREAAQDSDS